MADKVKEVAYVRPKEAVEGKLRERHEAAEDKAAAEEANKAEEWQQRFEGALLQHVPSSELHDSFYSQAGPGVGGWVGGWVGSSMSNKLGGEVPSNFGISHLRL